MDIFLVLIRDVRFWTALYLFVQTLLFYLMPDFPKEIWTSITALISAVLVILLGTGLGQTVSQHRSMKKPAGKRDA